MPISIIIPTLNESTTLPRSLDSLLDQTEALPGFEIIICDGGSTDDSLAGLDPRPIKIVHSEPGRAIQMNRGAEFASNDWLLFLHADTRLPPGSLDLIEQCSAEWGRFDVRLDDRRWIFRIIEKAINWRSCLSAVCTGDQAMFFRRDLFQQIGGFPAIPLMEDIAISKRARHQSRPACLRPAVTTSARRWQNQGTVRTILLMWSLRLAYWLGIKPDTLHRIYYPK